MKEQIEKIAERLCKDCNEHICKFCDRDKPNECYGYLAQEIYDLIYSDIEAEIRRDEREKFIEVLRTIKDRVWLEIVEGGSNAKS